MVSDRQQIEATETANRPQLPLNPEIILSLAIVPGLLAIVGIKRLSELLPVIGSTSEEVFRGDRLPVLHFPDDN